MIRFLKSQTSSKRILPQEGKRKAGKNVGGARGRRLSRWLDVGMERDCVCVVCVCVTHGRSVVLVP